MSEYKTGKIFVGRFDYGADVLDSVNEFCAKNNVKCGFVNLIGAVTSARIGYFDIQEQKYIFLEENNVEKPYEIASCSGNISIKDEKPFAHLHVVFSGRNGSCFGGHLMQGTKIYACEFFIQELIGEDLVRKPDQKTGLQLWEIH